MEEPDEALAEFFDVLHDTAINTFAAVHLGNRLSEHQIRQRAAEDVLELDAFMVSSDSLALERVSKNSVEAFVRSVASREGLTLIFNQTEGPKVGNVPENVTLGLRSCLREALTNIGKHAGVTEVLVMMRTSGDGFMVSVIDRGCGGYRESRGKPSSLQSRANRAGITLTVVSVPGKGTTCNFSWNAPKARSRPKVLSAERKKIREGWTFGWIAMGAAIVSLVSATFSTSLMVRYTLSAGSVALVVVGMMLWTVAHNAKKGNEFHVGGGVGSASGGPPDHDSFHVFQRLATDVLRHSMPLLRSLADGTADPNVLSVKQRSFAEECRLRAFLEIDPALGFLGKQLIMLVAFAQERGVRVKVTCGQMGKPVDSDVSNEIVSFLEHVLGGNPERIHVVIFPRGEQIITTFVSGSHNYIVPDTRNCKIEVEKLGSQTLLTFRWA